MKKTLIVLAMLVSFTAVAEDDVYKRGKDKTFIAGCTDPTTRTDGTVLEVGEIAEVNYYIDKTDGNLNTPEFTLVMINGCLDSTVDLQQFQVNTTYYKYGTATTTDALTSIASTPGRSFVVQSANPNAPGQIR